MRKIWFSGRPELCIYGSVFVTIIQLKVCYALQAIHRSAKGPTSPDCVLPDLMSYGKAETAWSSEECARSLHMIWHLRLGSSQSPLVDVEANSLLQAWLTPINVYVNAFSLRGKCTRGDSFDSHELISPRDITMPNSSSPFQHHASPVQGNRQMGEASTQSPEGESSGLDSENELPDQNGSHGGNRGMKRKRPIMVSYVPHFLLFEVCFIALHFSTILIAMLSISSLSLMRQHTS